MGRLLEKVKISVIPLQEINAYNIISAELYKTNVFKVLYKSFVHVRIVSPKKSNTDRFNEPRFPIRFATQANYEPN